MKKLYINSYILSEEEMNALALTQMICTKISADDSLEVAETQVAEDIVCNIDEILENAFCEDDLNTMCLYDFLSDELPLEILIVDDEDDEDEEENPYFTSEYELNP